MTSKRSYAINPRPSDLGGGWHLRLLEDHEEMGGGVFPQDPELDPEAANALAFEDARHEGENWLIESGN